MNQPAKVDSGRHSDSIPTTGGGNKTANSPTPSSSASCSSASSVSPATTTTTGRQCEQNSVVAGLSKPATHGYSAVSLSPSRRHAVTACHDSIQIISIGPGGLNVERTIPFVPHVANGSATLNPPLVSSTNNSATNSFRGSRLSHFPSHHRPLRISEDLFEEPGRSRQPVHDGSHSSSTTTATTATATIGMMNVIVNDVAWSKNLLEIASSHNSRKQQNAQSINSIPQQSFIAAAGSNGSIVVWLEETLLQQPKGGQQQSLAPEVVLSQHGRAVNRLSWHPKRQMLLSASHDSTVRLWERKKVKPEKANKHQGGFSFPFFGDFQAANRRDEGNGAASFNWQCTGVFEPRCESVRDVGWNPMADDIFALCTSNGCLVVYNRLVRARVMLKLNAHDRDATTLHWHPTRPYTIATGGSNDRLVKVWNLEHSLIVDQQQTMDSAAINLSNNQNTLSSIQTDISDVSTDSNLSVGSKASTAALTFCSTSSYSRQPPEHVLAVAAPVKRVRWRPPATTPNTNQNTRSSSKGLLPPIGAPNETFSDRHESMLAVATVPVKGESGGGSGFVALWSYHRPYMPLSIIEGHKEGAVTDLAWLDSSSVAQDVASARSCVVPLEESAAVPRTGIWQHILSVGKDGRCLVQSLAKGERPISNVPPSCFAMANLTPFQRGYGSLQIFSVCQEVNRDSDYWLRSDRETETAPGIFREPPLLSPRKDRERSSSVTEEFDATVVIQNSTPNSPTITFYSLDQGDLDQTGKPATVVPGNGGGTEEELVIAPELVHMSRFADNYVFYPTSALPTLTDICTHNLEIAKTLRNNNVAQMWEAVASELQTAGVDNLADVPTAPRDIRPTISAILEERADNGDVQSCVVLCEVLQIVNADRTTKIPGLGIQLVREWYLSYIDLLRSMCLFAHASDVIRNCNDTFVSAQNKHSTSISESCQRCGKAILADRRNTDQNHHHSGEARRMCKSCKRIIGSCSICQEPVTGMFIWCPGCGHGGHLEHIMGWFAQRHECPTGCGHVCNMVQSLNAFPRSTSMRDLDKLDISLNS
ncbi:hypothetical protein ACA910_001913 [Epithemia clementina (nom. ined.)]